MGDHTGRGRGLGLKNNMQQTHAGHLALVMTSSLICARSLQLYHSTDWTQYFSATRIVGLAGSLVRALIRSEWNMPLSVLAMSFVLWLL